MPRYISAFTTSLDPVILSVLVPLAVWILLSGLDDLFVLLAYLSRSGRRPAVPNDEALRTGPWRRIALFVPCWREDGVIADMIHHNLSAVRYRHYDVFIGAYPNDEPTVRVVRELERQYGRVHLSLCPHGGPTSKADCLNWVYQRMILFEEENGCHFDMVLIHDAEDLIHPDELHWINYYSRDHDMIQTPVLPLSTPWWELTHGFYCDDFAESHTKDLAVRQALGGFIPSCGVGTGYVRDALEKIACAESNRVFEPSCLTEDYENGLRIHLRGFRQAFLPATLRSGAPMATREYFPRRFRWAVKQRTRWVTGIALQTWERHGWQGGWRQWYWLLRDRKGLIGNPVSLLANLAFSYGMATWVAARLTGTPWGLSAALESPLLFGLLSCNMVLQLIQMTSRAVFSARTYGIAFALAAPMRTVWGNWLNTVSTFAAVGTYTRARLLRVPLVWVKTEHAYPSRAALLPHKRPLEEILIGSEYVTPEELAQARSTKPRGVRLSEHLVHVGLLSEYDLYEALSLQLGLALGRIEPRQVQRQVARSLPAHIVREWNVLPVKIEAGSLHLATPDPPTEELHEILRRFTRLDIQVQLITPTNFRQLAEALL